MFRPLIPKISQSPRRSFSSSPSSSVPLIALIPADGIGKEVVKEAKKVLEALYPVQPLQFVELEAGFELFQKKGTALPKETLSALSGGKISGALFGAVSSPSHKVEGYSSPILAMRKHLDLYANIRPNISAPPNIPGSRPNVDMLIIRENTECLYIKKERLDPQGESAVAERLITKKASMRIAEKAFQEAMKRAKARNPSSKTKAKVTIVHKSNVLSVTDGLFRESALEVAKKYPSILVEEQLVDSMVYKMILQPSQYDVVVAPNLYGDILSDAAAALVGGLGLAPSANVSDTFALAEPVHGSAPDIVGKGIANPLATIRAAALLLDHIPGVKKGLSQLIEASVFKTLEDGTLTPDLGGKATTEQVTQQVIKNLNSSLK